MVLLVTSTAGHLYFSARVTAFSAEESLVLCFMKDSSPLATPFPFMFLYEYMATKGVIRSQLKC